MLKSLNQKLKLPLKGKSKRLWKFFIFLFLINFIILNWSDISWMFNYKFISRGFLSFFEKDKTRAAENGLPTLEILKDLKKSNYGSQENSSKIIIDKENSIEIPKIGIKAPLIFPQQNTQESFQEALKMGVLHYPQSALPGEEGQSIILGHSAPPNWPKINYDWVFNDLNELNLGDMIYVYFNQRQYVFLVTEKFFLNKGQEIPSQGLTNSKSVVILLSCWPPGRDQKRIAIRAELQL